MATYKFEYPEIECCGDCPLLSNDGSIYYCELTDNEIADYMNKPTDCPLVLVKED
jgi:hypothetical protein